MRLAPDFQLFIFFEDLEVINKYKDQVHQEVNDEKTDDKSECKTSFLFGIKKFSSMCVVHKTYLISKVHPRG
jgi:hypothetical protein